MASRRFVASSQAEAAKDARRRSLTESSRQTCNETGLWRNSLRAFMKHIAFETGVRVAESVTSGSFIFEDRLPIDKMMARRAA